MAVNKVVIKTSQGERVLIDLTALTVTPETLAEGVMAINAAGEIIIGVAKFDTNTKTAKLGSAVIGTMMLGSEM